MSSSNPSTWLREFLITESKKMCVTSKTGSATGNRDRSHPEFMTYRPPTELLSSNLGSHEEIQEFCMSTGKEVRQGFDPIISRVSHKCSSLGNLISKLASATSSLRDQVQMAHELRKKERLLEIKSIQKEVCECYAQQSEAARRDADIDTILDMVGSQYIQLTPE